MNQRQRSVVGRYRAHVAAAAIRVAGRELGQ